MEIPISDGFFNCVCMIKPDVSINQITCHVGVVMFSLNSSFVLLPLYKGIISFKLLLNTFLLCFCNTVFSKTAEILKIVCNRYILSGMQCTCTSKQISD